VKEGEATIFRPDAAGEPVLVGRVLLEEWKVPGG
jgi:hypothetical protein